MRLQFFAPFLCLVTAGAVRATALPTYPDLGTPVQATSLTALVTGAVVGLHLGGATLGNDSVRLVDLTTGVAFDYVQDNLPSVVGQTYVLGYVNAGDSLALELQNTQLSDPDGHYLASGGMPNPLMSSDAQMGTDGVSHTWVTSDGNSGLFAYFEDIPHLLDPEYPGFFYTDSDYNDVRLDLSNVAGSSVLPAVTPEPGTFVLLGTGLAGGFATVRRRFHRL